MGNAPASSTSPTSSPIDAAVAASVAIALVALVAGPGRADTLEDDCHALDRTAQTSCRVERPRKDEWVLNTGYQVGTGRKAVVEIFEARFCDAALRAGVAGRVLRTGEIPNVLGKGAVMEFHCGMPAVSSAPRRGR